MDRKIAIVKAIGKVLWIQNDLFAKWYVRDGDEFAGEMEEIVVEREGWLKGKQVIDAEGKSVGEEGEPSGEKSPTDEEKTKEIPTSCPFAGFQVGKE